MDLFNYNLSTKGKIKSERALVISDILELVNGTDGIKKKLTARNCAVFLSPYPTSDLYILHSKMKLSKNPAKLFWWYVKNIEIPELNKPNQIHEDIKKH